MMGNGGKRGETAGNGAQRGATKSNGRTIQGAVLSSMKNVLSPVTNSDGCAGIDWCLPPSDGHTA